MPDNGQLREQRSARDAARVALHDIRHASALARQQLDLARRRGDGESAGRFEKEIEALTSRDRTLEREIASLDLEIDRLRDAVLTPSTQPRIEPLDSAVPIALLPVRVETHFARTGEQITELRIRVFPDDVHVDAHERELTDEDVEEGRAYWEEVWRAGPDAARRNAAWRALAEATGLERAAWVALQTTPQNSPPALVEPLPPDQPLPEPPEFPDPPRKAEEWSRSPLAAALPDRWIAIGFRGGQRIFTQAGSLIAEPLAVGPDPTAERAADEDLFVDEASRWTIDFSRAEIVGMGITVRASQTLALEGGLDLLLVLGVKGSASPDEGAETLTRVFEAQRYTEGLAFLRRGVPTNNTEAERSGWHDTTLPDTAAAAPAASAFTPGDPTNAGRWSATLGMNAEQALRAFGAVDGATAVDEGEAMATALWPATWGYLLEHLAGEDVRRHVVGLRQHVLAWVRGGGHHASIRLGNQPYGLLVHTDLNALQPGESPERDLLGLLLRLRDNFWLPAIARAPRIGRTGDPERDLVEVLGQRAASASYAVRPVVGIDFLTNLSAWVGAGEFQTWRAAHQATSRTTAATLGLPIDARVLDVTHFSTFSEDIPALVQAGAIRPGQALDPNYIQWLLDHGHDTIQAEEFPGPPPATLLYLLLRHSALQETARASVSLIGSVHPAIAMLRLEPEMIDIHSQLDEGRRLRGLEGMPTLSRVMDVPIAGVTEGQSVGAFLSARRKSTLPALGLFRAFWDALERLKNLPVTELELLLRETLDVSAYRLDAWLSSFPAKLLAERRAEGIAGVHVGGYGWLEDVRPRTALRSAGYIHTPSPAHAGLAAVLRSGYLSHRDAGNGDAFATDLSSERVRLAMWLLDGVRAGQSLGALLGYRFERALHEQHSGLELDVFIHALRRRAPLVAGRLEPTLEPFEAVAARHVVDGLALVRRWQHNELTFDAPDLPAPGTAHHTAIVAELNALTAVIDAVGDALLAESVYQLGNPGRSGATLDAIASGELPPPELEFARTPRSGLGIVHRIAVMLSSTPPDPPVWASDARQARALADPALDAWVGQHFGTPDRYRYRVRYLASGDGALLDEDVRSLAALQLSALDVLFLADAEDVDGASELLDRARHEATMNRPAGVPPDARIDLQLHVAADPVTMGDLLEIARAARRVLQDVRPLDGAQFAAPGETAAGGADLPELELRAAALVSRFSTLESRLATFLDDEDTAPLDVLRDALLGLHAMGVPAAIPRAPVGSGDAERQALTLQARAVVRTVATRRRELNEVVAEFAAAGANDQKRVAHARDRVRAVLGRTLPVLPRFTIPDAAEVAQSLANEAALTAGDSQAVVTWLQRHARVRDRVADFNDLLLYGGAINARDAYELRVAQLPFRAGSVWAALPVVPDFEDDANRLSLVLAGPPADPALSLTGFIVDEWPETIPRTTQTTAVTVHYDQPAARPPNALLLAVAPDASKPWTLAALEAVVRDALQLAKIRAVDGDSLQGLGHLLPALFFASNAQRDTIDMPLHRIAVNVEEE
jgi:hypothetical protein